MINRKQLIEFCKTYPDHRFSYTPGAGNGAGVYSPTARTSHRIHGNLYNALVFGRELETVKLPSGVASVVKLKAAR